MDKKAARLPTWRELNLDTDPKTEAVLIAMWRKAPAKRKLAMMADLNLATRELALTGLSKRNEHASPDELQRMLANLLLGEELAAKVYGPVGTET